MRTSYCGVVGQTEKETGRFTRPRWLVLPFLLLAAPALIEAAQPKVSAGPSEPNWVDLLRQQWGLDMERDLRNPWIGGVYPACMFVKAGKGPVKFTPIIALGMEKTTHGGWYLPSTQPQVTRQMLLEQRSEAWAYTYKQPASEIASGEYAPPKPDSGSAEFDPGDKPFGLWVSNDNFDDGGVFSDPAMVRIVNQRLQAQPYKAMVYPNVDKKSGQPIPNSYIIGWEYSDNDDFQDVVTRIDSVRLLPAASLPGITKGKPAAGKLAGGFGFTEGPTWDFKRSILYFSDIPPAHIMGFADGKARIINGESSQSNGLMMDKQGMIVACEHSGRRLSRALPGEPGKTIVDRYEGKRLNSPNDLWIDADGGIYFTDPRYGARDDLELDKEAVYYVTAGGEIERIIDDLVRPNGIALSPDGKTLYVVDNGASLLYRYPVQGPGKIGKGKRIAYTVYPDGMSVDKEGRLYVTGLEGVLVLGPDGKWLGAIECPEQPANCTFGGEGYRTLFITARTGLYSIETQTRGWHVHLDGVPEKK